jgi:diphthamide synthase (EF-2-diphthine--ammonia ligase)
MGTEWLGRQLDESFYNDVLKLGNVDACGEGGEFHTVITDGPNFRSRIELVQTKKSTAGNYGHLDIEKFKVVAKN